jgi:hypothetical protein
MIGLVGPSVLLQLFDQSDDYQQLSVILDQLNNVASIRTIHSWEIFNSFMECVDKKQFETRPCWRNDLSGYMYLFGGGVGCAGSPQRPVK